MSDGQKSKWHMPMYSLMWQGVWFVAFGWLVMIDLHFQNWGFGRIGKRKDWRIGIVRISWHSEDKGKKI